MAEVSSAHTNKRDNVDQSYLYKYCCKYYTKNIRQYKTEAVVVESP